MGRTIAGGTATGRLLGGNLTILSTLMGTPWLPSFDGAVLAVSHDRYFMDRVMDNIWEMMFGSLEIYRGNYSHYVTQRDERHELLFKQYETQQEQIQKEMDYIRRNLGENRYCADH